MAKLTSASFTRYVALVLESRTTACSLHVSTGSRGIGAAYASAIRQCSLPGPAFRIRLAAPGNQRRSNTTLSCPIHPHRLFPYPPVGSYMGVQGSERAARSLRDDLADGLTWHHVSVLEEPQSQRVYRKHLCIQVRNGSDAVGGCGGCQATHWRLPPTATDSVNCSLSSKRYAGTVYNSLKTQWSVACDRLALLP